MPESTDTPFERSLKPVVVNGVPLQPIEIDGQRAVTLSMIDKVHARPEGTARRNFNTNRGRLIEGKHYFVRNSSEAAALGIVAPNGLTALSERGYLMLVKSFTDDLAWQVQDALVESYFDKHRGRPDPMAVAVTLSDPAALRTLLLENVEERLKLASTVAAQAPKVAAYELIAETDGSFAPTDAAKTLGQRPRQFIQWLRMNRWTYRRLGSTDDIAYEDKLKAGLMVHKSTTVPRLDGTEKVVTRARLTPKGLAKLALVFDQQSHAA